MTKFFSKKTFIFILVFTLFLGLFLVNVGVAKANMFEDALRWFIKNIFWLILQIAYFFTGLIANLFTTILNFGFEDMRTIHLGWTISRDIVNMFFILGLIVIAFANILRIESYAMKTLLPKFIIMALIINFSYLACGIIIDSGQVITTYFLGLIKGPQQDQKPDVGMALLDSLAVTKSLIPPEGGASSVAITNASEDAIAWQAVINMAFSAIIIAVAGFALLVGTLLLFIRMGALWALIILCPFAWFLGIFPGKLKSQADKWWSEFIKWAFFAPIYVFFIYLILQIGQAIKSQTFLTNQNMTPETFKNVSYTDMMSNWTLIFNYVLLIILLFGASQMALSMGGKAASIGLGVVKGIYKLPGRLRASMVAPPGILMAIPGVRKVAKGLSFVAKWTTPEFWKKAYQARKEERLRRAGVPVTIGTMQNSLNKVLSFFTSKERVNYAEQAHQFEVDEEVKRMTLRTKGTAKAVISEMATTKDRNVREAGFVILAQHNDYNELLQSKEFGKPYGQTFSRENFVDLFYKLEAESGVSERNASAFLANLQEEGLRAGTNFYGAVTVDKKGFKRNSVAEMNQTSAQKAATIDQRKWIQTVHPMSMIKLDANNKYAGLDEGVLKEYAKEWTPGIINGLEFSRSRPDLIEKIGSVPQAIADIKRLAQTLSGRDKDSLEAFANQIENAAKTGRRTTGTAPQPTAAPTP